MRSLKFPNMFNSNSTNVWKESEYNSATKQSLQLLLQTERGDLEYDPYFGILLKKYMFDQNNYVLREALIDTIYIQLALFIPQLKMTRDKIKIINDQEKGKVYVRFEGINQIDFTPNMFSLLMFKNSDI